VCAPLRAAGRPAALLYVHRAAPAPWGDRERRLVEAVLRQAEAALANAVLFESQQQLVVSLRQLDQEKSDFVSTVSHELRTPLTSIMGYLELLGAGEGGPLTDDQAALVEVVARNSHRLLTLIEDLLILARIESGALSIHPVDVDAGELVRGIAAELAPQAAVRQVTVRLDVADGLPAVLGDAGQLERVLLNLFTNALKFTPPTGTITVSAHALDGLVQVVVADTGIGIPADELPRLFDRFFRASTAHQQAVPGTGLGLAIARRIVEAHGGTIAVESAVGAGTTVTIALPAQQARLPQPEHAQVQR